MATDQITVLGECVADAFVVQPGLETADRSGGLTLQVLPGGGPANTAVALARLGTPTRFLGRLSSDVFGTLFHAHLAASGVDLTSYVPAAESSTLAVAHLDDEGQARYSFHAEGTADWQWTAQELSGAASTRAACVHTGSLALIRQPGGTVVEDFLARARQSATISIDPNVRPLLVPPAAYRDRLARWCELADILRLSEDDLGHLLPDASPAEACDIWHAAGASLVVVTLGSRGALVSLNGRRYEATAPKVDTVDTVGAGDSFTAGLLHWLAGRGLLGGRLDGLALEDVAQAADFAARVAALTCSVAGANPPWGHQLAGGPATAPGDAYSANGANGATASGDPAAAQVPAQGGANSPEPRAM